MSASDHYDVIPSIDRDTSGVPGAPNISETILEKIRSCDAFVADISIVTGDKDRGQRPSPSPNVLIELGYAISELGWSRIILFCNTVYGSDTDLPFDTRQHRRITYELAPDDPKEVERKKLAKIFRGRLDEILDEGKQKLKASGPLLAASSTYYIRSPGAKIGSGYPCGLH
ncbi:MAG: nucleotide-binding protein [Gammaproteobacteria bacterium]|nr:nucleotide-binding protein [Gammaproteobacteria bacterium]